MLCVPLADLVPFQAPDAAQAVALVELQLKFAAPPLATTAIDALRVTDGTRLSVTLAVGLVPPGPLQVRE